MKCHQETSVTGHFYRRRITRCNSPEPVAASARRVQSLLESLGAQIRYLGGGITIGEQGSPQTPPTGTQADALPLVSLPCFPLLHPQLKLGASRAAHMHFPIPTLFCFHTAK